jgi:hypothetical protein
VLSLAKAGLIVRVPGPRGLRMPDDAAEAVRKLRELGWRIDEADEIARAPPPRAGSASNRSNPSLLPPPELDYPPAHLKRGKSRK